MLRTFKSPRFVKGSAIRRQAMASSYQLHRRLGTEPADTRQPVTVFFADKSGRIVQFPTRESGSTPLNKLIRVKETLGLKIY
jgi:hypothetical protein